MTPLSPSTVRYIKLGAGGAFARASLDRGELQLGYHEVPHELCAVGDWDGVLAFFGGIRKTAGKAKDSMREVQDFYTLGPDCLWITFADGLLWWGFGVTRLLCYQALPAIRAKKLKLILRDFEPSPTPVSFVYRAGRSMPQKLRAFIDFVTPRMKSRLVFDP